MTENNKSLLELQHRAGAGDSQAQFALGLYYLPNDEWEFRKNIHDKYQMFPLDGTNIERYSDISTAFELAEDNNKASDELAFMWFEKAAVLGDAESQYATALCYFKGKGIVKNDNLAFKWLKISADQKFAQACNLLGDFFSQKENHEDALAYYQDAVSGGRKSAYIKWIKMILRAKGILDFDKAKDDVETFEKKIVRQFDYNVEQCNKKRFVPEDEDDYFYFENALDRIKRDSKWLISELKDLSFEVMKYKQELESEIKQKETIQKALHEKEKEMLSFFTHTMRNALATAPESLRQAIQLLGGEVYEKDTKHYQAINKIASLFSTLSLTDCLIDTFKQSISDPQEFKQSWYKDHTGEASPKWVIASALRQSLNRIIFMSDTTELRKLLGNPETALIKATRKSFIEEVLPFNVDSQGVDVFYDWTLDHISSIEVSITDFDKLTFGVNQVRFSLLFAITSELILNALKYWDGENRIQISWQLAEQDNYVFSVKNHCKANATSNLAGTHKGLAFIKRLVELLGEQAQFVCKSEDQLFTAELILNKSLFDGEV
ncbi:MAG: hypothetical protein WCP01_01880 [Methylococcaceae bacterium]|jgi:two-component sensor histidine kinase